MQTFTSDQSGAVTVDWVVLTAALVGLGLAAMSVVSSGVEDVSGDTATTLRGSIISTSFGSGGVVSAATWANACTNNEEWYNQDTDEDLPVDQAYMQAKLDRLTDAPTSELLATYADGVEEYQGGSGDDCFFQTDVEMSAAILAQRGMDDPWMHAGIRNSLSYDQPNADINQIIADFGITDDPNFGATAREKVEDLYGDLDNTSLMVIDTNLQNGVYTGAQAAVAQSIVDTHSNNPDYFLYTSDWQ